MKKEKNFISQCPNKRNGYATNHDNRKLDKHILPSTTNKKVTWPYQKDDEYRLSFG